MKLLSEMEKLKACSTTIYSQTSYKTIGGGTIKWCYPAFLFFLFIHDKLYSNKIENIAICYRSFQARVPRVISIILKSPASSTIGEETWQMWLAYTARKKCSKRNYECFWMGMQLLKNRLKITKLRLKTKEPACSSNSTTFWYLFPSFRKKCPWSSDTSPRKSWK